MILSSRGMTAYALATALLSTTAFAEPPSAGTSEPEPSTAKKVAFRVIGLMKTKSGAT